MELLSSSNGQWLIQPYRSVGAISLADGKELAKSRALSAVFKVPAGNGRFFISACDNTECADFGAAVAAWGLEKGHKGFVYIEQVKGRFLFCVCEDGHILYDAFIEQGDISDSLSAFAGLEVFVSGDEILPVDAITAVVGVLSEALNTDDFMFQIVSDGLAEPVPLWFYALLLLGFFIVATATYIVLKPKETTAVISPYKAFYDFHKADSINALNRLNQIFNAQTKLLALQGWELVTITPTRVGIAYELSPIADGLDARIGDMETLNRYASLNGLNVLVEPNKLNGAVTLMEVAANVQATSDLRLFEVEKVGDFLRDAVELYIPGATTSFIRDVAYDGRAWRLRELEVTFVRHDTRYLNTLGAIVEGLPVTFGGEKADLQIGQLVVDKGLISGKLKLSIIGE